MSPETLQILWYLVVGVSVIAYAILDGFDLGVGILHRFTKTDQERRVFLNAIGPVWDGNEVWLVIVGGALLAGFPPVYAMLFSGFYNLCMILLGALIFRATAIEFRSQRPSKAWRATWDTVFCLASLTIAFGIGLALGNLAVGVPLDAEGDLIAEQFNAFGFYQILIGLMAAALFAMHGAIYLVMKTEGELQKKLERWTMHSIVIFTSFYLLTTYATIKYLPHMLDRMKETPVLFAIPILTLLAILNVPREMHKQRAGRAFAFSCLGIALLISIFGIGTYPILVRSTVDPVNNSLTALNASSSPFTLIVLLVIVAIGVPLVLAYGTCVYRIFSGKVKIGPTSY